jgi:hypothetical protein
MRALTFLAVTALAVGCGGDDAPPIECTIGDPTQPIELELLTHDGGQTIAGLQTPMTAVPLVFPDQGGEVLLIGARARNLDACAATMTTSLRDPCTDEVVTVDVRPVHLDATADGWAEPRPDARSQWANLAVCPNAAATRDLQGQGYVLRVVLATDDGRSAEASIPIVPTCAADDITCLCQCQAGYNLGDECPADLVPGTPTACPAQ